jgi:ABC-type phosphate/phosphonate transport system substrate-binding protein
MTANDDDPQSLAALLNANRNKVLAGEHVTAEDYSALIDALRAGRLRSAANPTTKRTKATVIPIDPSKLEELF